jgi:hypothetical protein
MEADQIAAVLSRVSSNYKHIKRASMLGATWGIGHTASLFVAGLLVLVLAVNMNEGLSSRPEFVVAIMLIVVVVGNTTFVGLSIRNFFKGLLYRRPSTHMHIHFHGGYIIHSHDHSHHGIYRHSYKALIVSMVHGMAGNGVLLLVVLFTIHSTPLGLAYVAIFGTGSIVGMSGTSTVMDQPFVKVANSTKLSLLLRYAAAATATLAIGAGLMYNLVLVDQILTS